jgi:hypothetical protein
MMINHIPKRMWYLIEEANKCDKKKREKLNIKE